MLGTSFELVISKCFQASYTACAIVGRTCKLVAERAAVAWMVLSVRCQKHCTMFRRFNASRMSRSKTVMSVSARSADLVRRRLPAQFPPYAHTLFTAGVLLCAVVRLPCDLCRWSNCSGTGGSVQAKNFQPNSPFHTY